MYSYFIRYLENLQSMFDMQYLVSSTALSITVGLIAAAFVIVSISTRRKNVALGVITSIFLVLGVAARQQVAHLIAQTDWVRNAGDAQFYTNLNHSLIPLFAFVLLTAVAWSLTFSFIIVSIGKVPRTLGILALIFHVAHMALPPINLLAPFFGQLTAQAQMTADLINYGALLFPLLLIMLGSVARGPLPRRAAAHA